MSGGSMSRPFKVGDRVMLNGSISYGPGSVTAVGQAVTVPGLACTVRWDQGPEAPGYLPSQLVHLDKPKPNLDGLELQGERGPVRVTTEPPKFRIGDRVTLNHVGRQGTIGKFHGSYVLVAWDDGSHSGSLPREIRLVARPLQVGDRMCAPGGGSCTAEAEHIRDAADFAADWTHADGTPIYVPEQPATQAPARPTGIDTPIAERMAREAERETAPTGTLEATSFISERQKTQQSYAESLAILARALHATDPQVLAFVERVAEHCPGCDRCDSVTLCGRVQERREQALAIAWDRNEGGWRESADRRAVAAATFARLNGSALAFSTRGGR